MERKIPKEKLPITCFNHIAREVVEISKSKEFYVDILGFVEIPRPSFENEGIWLLGYGLNLHLIKTTVPEERLIVQYKRNDYFSKVLPQVDHLAFISNEISIVKNILINSQVFFKEVINDCGIIQLFFFDPDQNVIEISNCGSVEQRLDHSNCGTEIGSIKYINNIK